MKPCDGSPNCKHLHRETQTFAFSPIAHSSRSRVGRQFRLDSMESLHVKCQNFERVATVAIQANSPTCSKTCALHRATSGKPRSPSLRACESGAKYPGGAPSPKGRTEARFQPAPR